MQYKVELTIFKPALGVRTTKSYKLLWYNPVQISVLYSLKQTTKIIWHTTILTKFQRLKAKQRLTICVFISNPMKLGHNEAVKMHFSSLSIMIVYGLNAFNTIISVKETFDKL